jgi:hypothetical protein
MNIRGLFGSLSKESQQNKQKSDNRDRLVRNLDLITANEERYDDSVTPYR